jgi:Tol biopolymer transport system component
VIALLAALVLGGAPQPAALTGKFAYSTRAGDIWVVDADGSHRRRVTSSGGGFDFKPTWSPDGKRIAFQTTRGSRPPAGETNIFVVGADGKGERQLTTPARFRYGGSSPDWAPAGGLIAFGSAHGLALLDTRTGAVRLLGLAGDAPVWSPDGSRIAYAGPAGAGSPPAHDVFVVAPDGTHARRLTNDAADEFPGAWSPDGTKLAYYRQSGGGGHGWVTASDGSGSRQLTRGGGTQFPSAWLPGGRLLVGASKAGKSVQTWSLVRPDGSGAIPLPQLDGAIAAAWHR